MADQRFGSRNPVYAASSIDNPTSGAQNTVLSANGTVDEARRLGRPPGALAVACLSRGSRTLGSLDVEALPIGDVHARMPTTRVTGGLVASAPCCGKRGSRRSSPTAPSPSPSGGGSDPRRSKGTATERRAGSSKSTGSRPWRHTRSPCATRDRWTLTASCARRRLARRRVAPR